MKRDSNLFEALRALADEPNPVASPAPAPSRKESQGPKVFVAAICLGLVFSLGYMLGGGGGEAKAGELDQSAQPLGTTRLDPWRPVGQTPGNRLNSAEAREAASKSVVSDPSTLYNAKNQYTVLAITYSDVPSLQGRAKAISEYLRSQGLPAFDPVPRAGNIEILVGAAETQGALVKLTAKLRGTRGPSGRAYDFQSAFVVNIDDHLDRD